MKIHKYEIINDLIQAIENDISSNPYFESISRRTILNQLKQIEHAQMNYMQQKIINDLIQAIENDLNNPYESIGRRTILNQLKQIEHAQISPINRGENSMTTEPSMQAMQDAIIDDAVDTCLNDSGYLKSILQDYFRDMDEETTRKMYYDMMPDQDWE